MSTGFSEARPGEAIAQPRAKGDRPVLNNRLITLMCGLCIGALAIAAFARVTGIGVQKLPHGPAAALRDLSFADMGHGVIEIRDAADGAVVQTLKPGEGMFLRTVMRGMAQDRLNRGGDKVTPFRLTLQENGHLVIRDPMSGREIFLNAFGELNRGDFTRLLPPGAAAMAAPKKTTAAGAAKTEGGVK